MGDIQVAAPRGQVLGRILLRVGAVAFALAMLLWFRPTHVDRLSPLQPMPRTSLAPLHMLKSPLGPFGPVFAVAFSPRAPLLATGQDGHQVGLWSIPDGKLVRMVENVYGGRGAITFSPDGTLLAVATEHGFSLVSVADGSIVRWVPLSGGGPLAFSPAGDRIAAGDSESVRLFLVADGAPVASFATHCGDARSLAFSPDGELVAVGSYQNSALLRAKDGAFVRALAADDDHIGSVAFSPSGDRLVLLVSHPTEEDLESWSLPDGKLLRRIDVRKTAPTGTRRFATQMALSADGRLAAISDVGGRGLVFSLEDGSWVYTLRGHTYGLTSIAFSPRGDFLATGSGDAAAGLWSVPPD